MTFCPFCGVRADIDLRQIHFRDLGQDGSMPCPQCTTPLGVIEFDTEPKIEIERCGSCFGLFFNPGEMESLLDAQTNPLIWLDPPQLRQISADYDEQRAIVYRKCPKCAERMSHINFGGHSGVILDSCGTHGVWLGSSNLRRLTEWWRAGGKLLYQQNEAERVKRMYDSGYLNKSKSSGGVFMMPDSDPVKDGTWLTGQNPSLAFVIMGAVVKILKLPLT
jgi:Zn-finger nucleic acid-binding protein